MILIGLPVYKRAWIMSDWFAAIEKQTVPLSELGFVFELGPDDDETHELLWRWHMNHPEVAVFDGTIRMTEHHDEHPEHGRSWNRGKYEKMATLRNHLLDTVVSMQPDVFFSLDSDILLESDKTLEILAERALSGVAVSPLSYMFPSDERYPSVMSWVDRIGGKARRMLDKYPIGTNFKAEIIMAAVAMPKHVYETTRYTAHRQGEDLGWSTTATMAGHELWCSSDLYGAHIMHKDMLEPYLKHGDPRSPLN
jgi:hypothetical protein